MIPGIGKQICYRIARRAYLALRGEGPNEPRRNGEYALLERVQKVASGLGEKIFYLDVGANLGNWTNQALVGIDGGNAKIIAYEPVPAIADQLRTRFSRSIESGHFEIREKAVSDINGEVAVINRGPFAGTASIAGPEFQGDVMSRTAAETIPVTSVTLDAEWHNWDDDDSKFIVKTDVEGFDCEAILGAADLFRSQRILYYQFEYNSLWIRQRRFLRDVFQHFVDLPFIVGRVHPQGFFWFREWSEELEKFNETNYAIVSSSIVSQIGGVCCGPGKGNVLVPKP